MLSSINRYIVRISSLLVCVAFVAALTSRAEAKQTFVFNNAPLAVSRVATFGGKLAISVQDEGLRTLLHDIGASITWNPGDRYVLFTTAEPQIVSFAVGDTRYDIGPRSAQASFAPYDMNGTVYVPFDELMSALYLSPKHDGGEIVLQPQLASFDVRASGDGSTLIARAPIPLHPRVIAESASQLVYAFDGVGTTLDRSRSVSAAGVRSVTFAQSGTVRMPVTTVTITLVPGTSHSRPSADDDRAFMVAVGGGAASGTAAVAAPEPIVQDTPVPSPAPIMAASTAAVAVTGVTAQGGPNGYSVDVSVGGDASYDWHRLRDPDNRFWVDVHGATLATTVARDITGTDPVETVRVRQLDADTVRVALSLNGPKRLDVTPSSTGIHIVIYDDEAGEDVARAGSGTIGTAAAVAVVPSPAPNSSGEPWKFGARSGYVATNPRLIVIDPGHGGSDPGSVRGNVREAQLTLDMAKRLRDVLVARGWQVIMTRTTDVDVYKPNDSAHEELQARDDVANNAGARLFVSIHVNAFINAGPRGTTTYYSKPDDIPLAQAVQSGFAAALGTKDDGTVKSHLYVTLHAAMPAILVETAFLSNPDDLAKLTSSDWREKLATAIADGIKNYAGAPPAAGQAQSQ